MTAEPHHTQPRFIGMPDGMYKNKTRRKARHCLANGGVGGHQELFKINDLQNSLGPRYLSRYL
jgi:hypothetical protein